MQELRDAVMSQKLIFEQIERSRELIASIPPLTFER